MPFDLQKALIVLALFIINLISGSKILDTHLRVYYISYLYHYDKSSDINFDIHI